VSKDPRRKGKTDAGSARPLQATEQKCNDSLVQGKEGSCKKKTLHGGFSIPLQAVDRDKEGQFT